MYPICSSRETDRVGRCIHFAAAERLTAIRGGRCVAAERMTAIRGGRCVAAERMTAIRAGRCVDKENDRN